jgi:uncharacterized protein
MVLSAYRSYLSVVMGIVILLTGLGLISGRVPWLTSGLAKFAALLKKTFGQVIQRKSPGNTFVLGVINGFIPCGISGMALAYCFILPDASTGFLTMVAFGMGTWPMMLFYPLIMKTIGGLFRLDLRKATVVMMVVSGVLMIGNGVWSQGTLSIAAEAPSASMILCP